MGLTTALVTEDGGRFFVDGTTPDLEATISRARHRGWKELRLPDGRKVQLANVVALVHDGKWTPINPTRPGSGRTPQSEDTAIADGARRVARERGPMPGGPGNGQGLQTADTLESGRERNRSRGGEAG